MSEPICADYTGITELRATDPGLPSVRGLISSAVATAVSMVR
jgi:hypothetical protein